jgi:hypothetical protein
MHEADGDEAIDLSHKLVEVLGERKNSVAMTALVYASACIIASQRTMCHRHAAALMAEQLIDLVDTCIENQGSERRH